MATRSIDMPLVGMPAGEKPARASFKPRDVFDRLLEAQGGSRVAWTRVLRCACQPSDAVTDAPKRSCPHCKGEGWMAHLPEHYLPPPEAGILSPLQKAIITEYKAVVIVGFMSDLTRSKKPFSATGDELGDGQFRLTVRPENRLNHYDRVVLLDSIVPFDEVRELPANETVLPLRYKVAEMITLRDVNGEALRAVTDYQLAPDGRVLFPSKTKAARRFGALYNTHPVARVVSHMHLARHNIAAAKKKPRDLITPSGDPLILPLQVKAELEWLVK